jgi:hypothetical protein
MASEGRVTFRALGDWKNPERIHDGAATTGATTETSPASLFLLLDSEAVLSGVELQYVGRLVRASLQVSDDGLNWTSPSQQARANARAGRHEIIVAPISARSAMLRIEFQGRSFELRDAVLKTADLDRVKVYGFETEGITENSAVLKWKTSLPIKTNLLYGFSHDRMKSPSSPSFEQRLDHQIRLTDLLPGIEYMVWIIDGTDTLIGAASGRPFTFKTRGEPYPFANAIRVATGRDTASIGFSTPIPARAWINWKAEDGSASGVAESPRLAKAHRVGIDGLRPRTPYIFEVVTEDGGGRRVATPIVNFATLENNVAIGARATGTFSILNEDQLMEDTRPALERITDGRNDSFKGMATSGDPADTDQWIEVDLGREVSLSSIETVWRGNAYPQRYYIMTSRDRENWLYPAFDLDAGAGAFERSTRGDPLRRVAVAPASEEPVRYIKILILKGSPYFVRSPYWRFVQIAEIEAHGVWK